MNLVDWCGKSTDEKVDWQQKLIDYVFHVFYVLFWDTL